MGYDDDNEDVHDGEIIRSDHDQDPSPHRSSKHYYNHYKATTVHITQALHIYWGSWEDIVINNAMDVRWSYKHSPHNIISVLIFQIAGNECVTMFYKFSKSCKMQQDSHFRAEVMRVATGCCSIVLMMVHSNHSHRSETAQLHSPPVSCCISEDSWMFDTSYHWGVFGSILKASASRVATKIAPITLALNYHWMTPNLEMSLWNETG